jgi:hypothetical protein
VTGENESAKLTISQEFTDFTKKEKEPKRKKSTATVFCDEEEEREE